MVHRVSLFQKSSRWVREGLQISDDLYPFINLERQTYEIGIVMPAGGSDATTKIKTTFKAQENF